MGLVAAAVALPSGTVRYVAPPPVIVPIAAPANPVEPRPPARLSLVEPDIGAGPPAAIDPRLGEATPAGILPRTGPDGLRPLALYARPSDAGCRRACVAVVVTSLGLLDRLGERALALPARVALSFSPYAEATPWQGRARAAGHEVLLGLPLQPADARDDPGPLAVPAGQPVATAVAALHRVLARGGGYVALDAEAGAFAGDAFAPLADELSARGLGLIEIGGNGLAAAARAAGLPYASAMPVDAAPMPEAVDRALAEIAATAIRDGRALAVAGPTPGTLERLARWLETLSARGIELVPPSRLLLDEPTAAVAHP
jgi:polysaccharide deacetylase 2 family uncharacterized protein YibQ